MPEERKPIQDLNAREAWERFDSDFSLAAQGQTILKLTSVFRFALEAIRYPFRLYQNCVVDGGCSLDVIEGDTEFWICMKSAAATTAEWIRWVANWFFEIDM